MRLVKRLLIVSFLISARDREKPVQAYMLYDEFEVVEKVDLSRRSLVSAYFLQGRNLTLLTFPFRHLTPALNSLLGSIFS